MIDSDAVLHLVKSRGPVLPVHITKEVKQDLLFTSAMLSELVSKKKIKISYLKVGGGSPLYYYPGQEEKLKEYVKYLPENDRKMVQVLEKKRVLRDSELGAETRASLRRIKDFALPLQVTIGTNKELFWKWYLLDQQEATNEIKVLLGYIVKEKKQEKKVEKPKVAEKKEEVKEFQKPELSKEEKPEVMPEPVKEIKPVPVTIKEQPKSIAVQQPKIELAQATLSEAKESQGQNSEGSLDEPSSLEMEPFLEKLYKYFDTSDISILDQSLVKKGKEYDFILQIVSTVGPLKYYCRAKHGKRINEGELSSSFIIGQSKKLPTLFLSTGILPKKASEFLEKELPGVVFKTIDHGS